LHGEKGTAGRHGFSFASRAGRKGMTEA